MIKVKVSGVDASVENSTWTCSEKLIKTLLDVYASPQMVRERWHYVPDMDAAMVALASELLTVEIISKPAIKPIPEDAVY